MQIALRAHRYKQHAKQLSQDEKIANSFIFAANDHSFDLAKTNFQTRAYLQLSDLCHTHRHRSKER
ncbi:hypothetical protein QYQ99_06265 [Comamonas testosteroni]|uniref:hypothetical protein n=1 Tax=Comamonas testosteroni TaxID=285 RepID=UPI00265EB839|nr:hypothetical protein [Comamonas testosteroni]WKL17119.1 hypothetical protein QYQ99_06265 [Comamonas testosteroni]WQD44371.1 hypothetical protein U0024_06065 [Comamonas testosteroni]